MILDAWDWCTGMTQRDGMGREVIPKLLATLLWEYNFTTWHLGG